MSEQPEEENAEESTKDNSIDQTLRQGGNLLTPEQIRDTQREAQRIINNLPFSNFNEFSRRIGQSLQAAVYVQGAGFSGLSSPIRNFMPGFHGSQPAGIVATNYNATVGRDILAHENEINQLKSEIADLTDANLQEKEKRERSLITGLTCGPRMKSLSCRPCVSPETFLR